MVVIAIVGGIAIMTVAGTVVLAGPIGTMAAIVQTATTIIGMAADQVAIMRDDRIAA